MKEITGNIWDYSSSGHIVITTNGALNTKGECVMGRGTALQAKNRYPGLALRIGKLIESHGNHVYLLQMDTQEGEMLVTFPVKHHWSEVADLKLIARSVQELKVLSQRVSGNFFLPRPGCGNGGLHWDRVKPLLVGSLNDRFSIVELHP